MFLQRGIEQSRRSLVIDMSASFGFGHNAVDAAEFSQIGSRNAKRLRGKLLLRSVSPHDGGAGLGGNYGINSVLHHQHAISNRNGQRASAAAFPGDGGDNRNLQPRHLPQISRNGFSLAMLFS